MNVFCPTLETINADPLTVVCLHAPREGSEALMSSGTNDDQVGARVTVIEGCECEICSIAGHAPRLHPVGGIKAPLQLTRQLVHATIDGQHSVREAIAHALVTARAEIDADTSPFNLADRSAPVPVGAIGAPRARMIEHAETRGVKGNPVDRERAARRPINIFDRVVDEPLAMR